MRRWHSGALCGIALVVATTLGAAGGQSPAPRQLVTWTLEAPAEVRSGAAFTATLHAKVTPGWKFYAAEQALSGPRPMSVVVVGEDFTIDRGPAATPAAETVQDMIWSGRVAYHSRDTTFAITARPTGSPLGPRTLALTVKFQVCSDEICLKPTQASVATAIVVR